MKAPDIGYTFSITEKVTEELATSHMEGVPPMLSTPGLVFLIERAGDECLKGFIDGEEATVGTFISLHHLAPTPVGDSVKVTVKVDSVDGSKVGFSFVAEDSRGKIGEGKHIRAVVNIRKFGEKLKRII